MCSNSKLKIYKGIIQYLLGSTHYTLKGIALLSHSTIANIRAIYQYEEMPLNLDEERHLLRLYQIILEQEDKEWPMNSYRSH